MVEKDLFGPEYIIKVYDPEIGMKGFLVIDNLALGPGKGGIRMTESVNEEEICRLARTMTWKNALAGLPFGGAKAGIIYEEKNKKFKKQFIQSFAKRIKVFIPNHYIAGPDVNTGEKEMQWFIEAVGSKNSATGKPAKLGGLPHELGSTGFGVAQATAIAAKFAGIDIKRATVAFDGFGNVGSFAFKYLQKMGAKIVGVADKNGTVYSNQGFEEKTLQKLKSSGKSVIEYPGGEKMDRNAIFTLPVDILIPASVTDVINDQNKNQIKAKIIVEAANIPMNEQIEKELFEKGVLIVPDFVANAGGVISSYAEHRGYNTEKMFKLVERKIIKITEEVLQKSLENNQSPRNAALQIAQSKILSKKTRKS